jgi:hypothetical protein
MKTVFFFTLIFVLTAYSQEQVKAPVDSLLTTSEISANSISPALAADSLSVEKKSVATDSSNRVIPAVKLTKRNYNHREQVIFGTAMMAFLAIVITTVQNMNPN